MPVFVLYRPNSEHDSQIQAYAREAERVTGHKLSLISLNTPEGADKAKLYDAVRYPAIVATKDDGQLLMLWQDEMLPTINEVAAYFSRS